ncbi:hypothetical protein GX48_02116 [Paracoccidioides brasiliensis]|nr:hypothetical protein GX48_02116 [Paracoccidioides brasiliensis]
MALRLEWLCPTPRRPPSGCLEIFRRFETGTSRQSIIDNHVIDIKTPSGERTMLIRHAVDLRGQTIIQ